MNQLYIFFLLIFCHNNENKLINNKIFKKYYNTWALSEVNKT